MSCDQLKTMTLVKRLNEITEEPHPFLHGVTMRTLLSKRDENADTTCIIVRCDKGSEIEEHIHTEQDDIIYVLAGEATMWIEDRGSFTLESGVFVVVPKGLKHRTYNVKEELLLYDVFTPAMF